MSMLGRGGGNFYVPLLLASGFSMMAAAAGCLLGGKISIKVPPQRLKMLFVFTTILATFFIVANAVLTR